MIIENQSAKPKTLSNEDLQLIDSYWRAANYLAAGQIYLQRNSLLKRPLGSSVIGELRRA
jgi:xylulose-5-phosphate/fructose-6-phosphate phosphoketolase